MLYIEILDTSISVKEILQHISYFGVIFAGLPQVSLEDQKWPAVVRNLLGKGRLLALRHFDTQLNHIQHLVFIESSKHQIIWPLFAVRAKQEQAAICRSAIFLYVFSRFEWMCLMSPSVIRAIMLLNCSLNLVLKLRLS